MTVWILSVVLLGWQSPGLDSPRQTLAQQMAEGAEVTFSDVELALLASGAVTADDLQTYAQKYEAMIAGMMPDERQAKQREKRLANTLMKNIFKYALAADAGRADLRQLIDDRSHGPLTATFVLMDLAQRNNIDVVGLVEDERLSTYFLSETRGGLRELAAAMATQNGVTFSEEDTAQVPDLLELSVLLAPASEFGIGIQDVQLYNRALRYYNDSAFRDSANVAVGGAARYPKRTEFVSLCYNIGIKLFQEASQNGYPETLRLGERLAPFTGQHRESFEKTLGLVRYNHAAQLFNNRQFEAALAALENADREQEGYQTILAGSLTSLIENKVNDGAIQDARALLPDLMEADPEQARQMERFIADKELQNLESSGQLQEALAKAAENLQDDRGRDNYVAVLTQVIQQAREDESKSLDDLLQMLDQVPAALKGDARISDIRFNSYIHWLKKYEDNQYDQIIPLFRKIFDDGAVDLTEEDKSALAEGYGNALFYQIEALIAEHKFREADTKSKQALKLHPQHEALQQQRKKIDVILERIAE